MKTVGSILQETRTEKHISLDQVEAATKIRRKFLEAIELDDYSRLPSLAYAKGFVKNYSVYLGLDSDTVLAFFRRQTSEIPRATLLPKGMAEPLNKPWFYLTPGRFLGLVFALLATSFLFYFGVQYRRLNQSPRLVIESPKDQTMTTDKRVDVLGQTDPDATVTVNGFSVIVRSDGNFFSQVVLEPGVNTLTVVATSRFGKVATVTRKVGLQQP